MRLKKLMSLVLACAMLVSLATVASAADKGSAASTYGYSEGETGTSTQWVNDEKTTAKVYYGTSYIISDAKKAENQFEIYAHEKWYNYQNRTPVTSGETNRVALTFHKNDTTGLTRTWTLNGAPWSSSTANVHENHNHPFDGWL